MSESRRRSRMKRCRRKIRYATAREAREACAEQERAFGKPMYVYACWHNGGRKHWHTATLVAVPA